MTNRDRVLRAAIELLAESGIRSLTHLRVDERAGLPRGSTSNVFRTREALLVGVCEHMVASEMPEVAARMKVHSVEELVESLDNLFAYLTGPSRTMTAARLALFVEAGHNTAVRDALAHGRATLEAQILPAFVELGAPRPQLAVQLIAVCFEGLFLHAISGRAEIDPRPVIAANVHAALRQ